MHICPNAVIFGVVFPRYPTCGRTLRIPFRQQILTLLGSDGEKRTAEFIAAIEGHPKAIKNELKRLVDAGEIVKVRWGVYALPQK